MVSLWDSAKDGRTAIAIKSTTNVVPVGIVQLVCSAASFSLTVAGAVSCLYSPFVSAHNIMIEDAFKLVYTVPCQCSRHICVIPPVETHSRHLTEIGIFV